MLSVCLINASSASTPGAYTTRSGEQSISHGTDESHGTSDDDGHGDTDGWHCDGEVCVEASSCEMSNDADSAEGNCCETEGSDDAHEPLFVRAVVFSHVAPTSAGTAEA